MACIFLDPMTMLCGNPNRNRKLVCNHDFPSSCRDGMNSHAFQDVGTISDGHVFIAIPVKYSPGKE
jgi:hypothetical protein